MTTAQMAALRRIEHDVMELANRASDLSTEVRHLHQDVAALLIDVQQALINTGEPDGG